MLPKITESNIVLLKKSEKIKAYIKHAGYLIIEKKGWEVQLKNITNSNLSLFDPGYWTAAVNTKFLLELDGQEPKDIREISFQDRYLLELVGIVPVLLERYLSQLNKKIVLIGQI